MLPVWKMSSAGWSGSMNPPFFMLTRDRGCLPRHGLGVESGYARVSAFIRPLALKERIRFLLFMSAAGAFDVGNDRIEAPTHLPEPLALGHVGKGHGEQRDDRRSGGLRHRHQARVRADEARARIDDGGLLCQREQTAAVIDAH